MSRSLCQKMRASEVTSTLLLVSIPSSLSFRFFCLVIPRFLFAQRRIIYIRRLVADLVKGAQHLHSLNIVHRDIKPANLLVFWTEELGLHGKLGDFGLSRGEFPLFFLRGIECC